MKDEAAHQALVEQVEAALLPWTGEEGGCTVYVEPGQPGVRCPEKPRGLLPEEAYQRIRVDRPVSVSRRVCWNHAVEALGLEKAFEEALGW